MQAIYNQSQVASLEGMTWLFYFTRSTGKIKEI